MSEIIDNSAVLKIRIVEPVDKKILGNQLPCINNGVSETGGMAVIVGAGHVHVEPRGIRFVLRLAVTVPFSTKF